MVEGLIEFRRRFPNQLWLEVFLLGGITDVWTDVKRIAEIAGKISPDKIQLNTVARPPAEDFAFPVDEKQMKDFKAVFGRNAEVIADFRRFRGRPGFSVSDGDVMSLLRRRPCSLDDIAGGLKISHQEAAKHVAYLEKTDHVACRQAGARVFYTVK
jgi:wyosine [tRNA(Phe)-imidazoG37] synthetase (radical SAM superfamily)